MELHALTQVACSYPLLEVHVDNVCLKAVCVFVAVTYLQPGVRMSAHQNLGSLMHYKCRSLRSTLRNNRYLVRNCYGTNVLPLAL